MAGEVEADDGFFFGEFFRFAPHRRVDELHRLDSIFHHVKQSTLIGVSGFLVGVVHGEVDVCQEHGAVGFDAVERAAAYQGFEGAAVHVFFADALAEVQEAGKLAAALPRGDDGFDGGFARAFNRAECVADFHVRIRRETVVGFVDVGRQELDAVGAAVVVEMLELVGVVQFRRHGCCHKLGRVMGFEPCGLIGNQGVGGGVGFVETVAGEFFHVVEDFVGFFARNALFCRAFGEDFSVFHHFFGFFLTHGAAQQVRAAERVTADNLRRLHHLFLIHHNAVGRREDAFEQRMDVLEFLTLHTRDEVWDVVHRAGAVERHEGDEFFKLGRVRCFQHFFHTGRLELEDGGGVRIAEDLVGSLIVKRNLADIDDIAGGVFDVVLRHFDNGQVAETQKVELHQTHVFHVALVVHGYGRGGFVRLIHGAVIGNLAWRNQHAACVHTQTARQVFQLFRQRNQFVRFFRFNQFLNLRLGLHGFFQTQGFVGFQRNQLGQFVAQHKRQFQHASDVANHRFGRHCAKGNNLADCFRAIFFAHIFNHAAAVCLTEVHVEVGHGDAFGV